VTENKRKRGDAREDGMIFWAYQSKDRGFAERWVTAEKYNDLIARERSRIAGLKLPDDRPRKRGDVDERGMVFWAYQKGSKNGEMWMTPAKIESKMNAARISDKKRSGLKHRKDAGNHRAKKARKLDPEKQRAKESIYRAKNRDRITKRSAEYNRKKRNDDPVFAMKCRLYCRVNEAFRTQGIGKKSRTSEILGCSFEKFKSHIESQFTQGMGWHNKGEWEIDHIIPLSCATTAEGLEKLFHYKNCQPMWATENRSKQNNLVLV
jgi:hypothetical protein